jgi:hypothetical protein
MAAAPRLTVALTFDHDAISDSVRRGDWTLDDWPLFEPGDNGRDGRRPPSQVLETWLAELRYAHANTPGGLLSVTMHPECIGRGHRMAMLEQFITECRKLDGVVFSRLDSYLEGWVDNR